MKKILARILRFFRLLFVYFKIRKEFDMNVRAVRKLLAPPTRKRRGYNKLGWHLAKRMRRVIARKVRLRLIRGSRGIGYRTVHHDVWGNLRLGDRIVARAYQDIRRAA